jgi:hypothetical protein
MATDEDLSLPNCGICHAIRHIPPHVHSMFQRPLQWTRNNQGSTAASSTQFMFAVVLGHFERFQGSTTASAQCSFFHADGQVRDVFSNQLRDHCTRTIDGILLTALQMSTGKVHVLTRCPRHLEDLRLRLSQNVAAPGQH